MNRWFAFLRNVNVEKGVASIAEMAAVLSVAGVVMVGGVALNSDDILTEASDVQKIANVRQLATALELHYAEYGAYLKGDFSILVNTLSAEGYLASLPTQQEQYSYKSFNSGQNYVLRAALGNPASKYMQASMQGAVEGMECQSPYYCIRM
ncbi:MAG: hypothetical protein HYT50_01295 [Candidatus Wildermuthbacteria bacterium]|nr:hypothetical protein [Candidatus Wildermuthbacteria bacterium]